MSKCIDDKNPLEADRLTSRSDTHTHTHERTKTFRIRIEQPIIEWNDSEKLPLKSSNKNDANKQQNPDKQTKPTKVETFYNIYDQFVYLWFLHANIVIIVDVKTNPVMNF